MHGDPARLLTPTDSEGRRCGLDDEVRGKPFLFYFDLTKCAAENAIIKGCPTPQVWQKLCLIFLVRIPSPVSGNWYW
jgi:choline transporter-like protein 2/4/5